MKPIEAIDHLHTTKAPRTYPLMEGGKEFRPKSTQEVVVMRWGEMEKKVGENGRGNGDEEGNMEDLIWGEILWKGRRDEWVLDILSEP